MLNREANQGRSIGNTELLHQPASVSIYRFRRERQLQRDLHTRIPLHSLVQHLAFSRAKALQGASCDSFYRTAAIEKSGYGRAEILFAG